VFVVEEKVEKNMNKYEDNLSVYACKNSDAVRLLAEKEDIRPPFFHDTDRIIYSLSYTRYIDKTQVFSFNDNDHISKRMTHVQMVSKIGRTIGRALGLNEDLIEAAALGHDLGHIPFGHEGEYILNEISKEYGEGYFHHNIQSVRMLMGVEKKGKGQNLNLQTLDAIMCHNGEFVMAEYKPIAKTFKGFLKEYEMSFKEKDFIKKLVPMTLEGCVVRISDIIAYIGKDIDDAIRLGILKREELPKDITNILGVENREIVNTIILDIIKNSFDKPYLKMSPDIYSALVKLKDYNYKNIYIKANTKEERLSFTKMIRTVFKNSLKDLENDNKNSSIYKNFLDEMNEEYLKNNSKVRIVIDYIAGMTDAFLVKEYKKQIKE